jgi:flagellar biosynthesis/type III secretory pathway M-ring protein FliF/YscJ
MADEKSPQPTRALEASVPKPALPASFAEVRARVEEFLSGLSTRQKMLLGAGVVAVGATLWVFVALLSQPKFVTLYSGLRAEDAQGMVAKLVAKNIPHQVSPDGGTLLESA